MIGESDIVLLMGISFIVSLGYSFDSLRVVEWVTMLMFLFGMYTLLINARFRFLFFFYFYFFLE